MTTRPIEPEDAAPHALGAFAADTLVELSAIERSLLVAEARLDDPSVIGDMRRRFQAIGRGAQALGLPSVQEVAQLAEKLVDLDRRGRQPLAEAEIDVARHAVDVLSLQAHDIRRRLDGHPGANVRVAAVAVRDRIRHAIKDDSLRH